MHFDLLKIWHFQNYSTYILKKTIQQAKKAKDDVSLFPMTTDSFQSRVIVGQTQWAGMHSPAYGGKNGFVLVSTRFFSKITLQAVRSGSFIARSGPAAPG